MDDDAFVRAPSALVHTRLGDVGGWSAWWPGVTTLSLGAGRVPGPSEPGYVPPVDDSAETADAAAPPDPRSDDVPPDRRPAERWGMVWVAGRRRLGFVADVHGWRPDRGFHLALDGDLLGRAEFWLEAAYGGTVVHHILVATTARRRPVRVLRTYRLVLRAGMWRLKDDLQSVVREQAGLAP